MRGKVGASTTNASTSLKSHLHIERLIFVAAGGTVGDVHDARIEINEDGADRHGAPGGRLLGVGMPANAVRRAAMVHGGQAHMLE